MRAKNSHCSFCGSRFTDSHLSRKGCDRCGNVTYLNPIPVAVVLIPVGDGIVVIRRNTEPRKGTLTLPGGYIDLGETWQEAARREALEETGIEISAGEVSLYDVQNGFDDTLVIFGLATHKPESVLRPFTSLETQETILIREPIELGFPMHTRVVERFFAKRG
jgi:ADP-ribose pyrophosphatase YjhB (NUDIX family)